MGEMLAMLWGGFWLIITFVILPIALIYLIVKRVKERKTEQFEDRQN